MRKQKSPLRLRCALSTLHKAWTLPLHTPRCMSVWRWAGKIQQGLPFFFFCHLAGNRSSLSKPLMYRSSQHIRIKKRKEHGAGAEQLQAIWLKFNVLTLQCSQSAVFSRFKIKFCNNVKRLLQTYCCAYLSMQYCYYILLYYVKHIKFPWGKSSAKK